MFGDEPPKDGAADDDDDLDAYGKLKRKKVNFVDYKTFEGQEIDRNERDVDDEEESLPSTPGGSDDEEVIDEEVGLAGLKKKPRRGCRRTAKRPSLILRFRDRIEPAIATQTTLSFPLNSRPSRE